MPGEADQRDRRPLPPDREGNSLQGASGTSAFHCPYRQAAAHRAAFVAVEHDCPVTLSLDCLPVELDQLTGPFRWVLLTRIGAADLQVLLRPC